MMRLNFSKRRVLQATAAIACATALSASAAAGHAAYSAPVTETKVVAFEAGSYASAGATSFMSALENNAYQKALTLSETDVALTADSAEASIAAKASVSPEASVEGTAVSAEVTAAASSVEAPAETSNDEWAARVCANVEGEMNVRSAPSTDSEVVGYLRRGDVGEVVERTNGWTKIISGNVTGYVRDDYLLKGQEAFAFASAIHPMSAISNKDGLRVRADATTDSDIVTALNNGEAAAVDLSYDRSGGWTKVTKGNKTGYVKNEFVTIGQQLSAGLTVEEYAQIKAAERAAERAAAKAAEEAKKKEETKKSSSQVSASSSTYTKNSSVSASASDLDLLAALIYCEAGAECYEGQVAVGATVVNRMHSGYYSNTIRGAIYDPWAYSPTWTGVLDRALANGNFCYAAAQDALNGVDPTGGAMSFKLASSGHPGVVIGRVVFF